MQLIRTRKNGEKLEEVLMVVEDVIKRLISFVLFHHMHTYDFSRFVTMVGASHVCIYGDNTDWEITGDEEEMTALSEFLYWHRKFYERIVRIPHMFQVGNCAFMRNVSQQELAAKELVFNFFAPKIKSKFVLANLCVLIVGNILNFELISRMISDPLDSYYSERIEKVITVVNECEGDSAKVIERLGIVTRNRIAEREMAVSVFAG